MSILIIILAIALQVYLTLKKVPPFLSLLIVAILTGLFLGIHPVELLKTIEKGVSSTLGGITLVLCLGAVLGKILESTGAAEKIATTLISFFGVKHIQWAMMIAGFLIGLPLYYNAGFVILVPLVFMVAKKTSLPLLYIAIPMAAALSTTHCFLPPHPGPVVLVNVFHADTGKVLIYGITIALPAVVIAGPLLGGIIAAKFKAITNENFSETIPNENLPSAVPSFLIALLPVLLITLSVLAQYFLNEGQLHTFFLFIGDTNVAMLVSVVVAFSYFCLFKQTQISTIASWTQEAIAVISTILLIITSGGVLKQVLTDSGTGAYISSFSSSWKMPPLLFAWVVTALLRVTIGSATVAGITAAGVVAPMIEQYGVSPELMVLAVGTGSVFGSHVNDSGFWMYKEFFKLSLRQTFLSWSLMETIISVVGLIGVLILERVI